ncbi:hypothetical protein NEDG_00376 [Nematocida displodere]|uniref:Uncharacterized protein n=1 Tax=Nematocida displodere TaxID=1805483 RepID=A0A177EKB8_9MICR|nr:hypothetical protein NEDG_00376 [Nematocida displodere]
MDKPRVATKQNILYTQEIEEIHAINADIVSSAVKASELARKRYMHVLDSDSRRSFGETSIAKRLDGVFGLLDTMSVHLSTGAIHMVENALAKVHPEFRAVVQEDLAAVDEAEEIMGLNLSRVVQSEQFSVVTLLKIYGRMDLSLLELTTTMTGMGSDLRGGNVVRGMAKGKQALATIDKLDEYAHGIQNIGSMQLKGLEGCADELLETIDQGRTAVKTVLKALYQKRVEEGQYQVRRFFTVTFPLLLFLNIPLFMAANPAGTFNHLEDFISLKSGISPSRTGQILCYHQAAQFIFVCLMVGVFGLRRLSRSTWAINSTLGRVKGWLVRSVPLIAASCLCQYLMRKYLIQDNSILIPGLFLLMLSYFHLSITVYHTLGITQGISRRYIKKYMSWVFIGLSQWFFFVSISACILNVANGRSLGAPLKIIFQAN